MKYRLVITHGGKFHADEILAIALAIIRESISWDTPIERRKKGQITEDEFNDSTVLILDTGRRYQPLLGNIDHHQDELLPATNMLLLNLLLSNEKDLHAQLSKKLFQPVSDVDCGIKNKKDLYADFNTIIRNYNGMSKNNFYDAIKLAHSILLGYIQSAQYCIRTKKYWKQYERVSRGKIAVMKPSDRYSGDWKEFAEEDGVYLLLLPNQGNKEYYNLMVRDTDVLKIPQQDDQNFLHNSGHIASYNSYEIALVHAKKMVRSLPVK